MKRPRQFRPRTGMRFDKSAPGSVATFSAGSLLTDERGLDMNGAVLTCVNRMGRDTLITQTESRPQASGGYTGNVDATSGVVMPLNSSQYQNWLTATSPSGIVVPDSLFLCNEAAGNLADSIGARTAVKTGNATYQVTAPGWSTVGVKVTDGSGTDWFTFAGENLSTTAVAMFAIVDVNTLGNERCIFSLGGSSTNTATEVHFDAAGKVIAKRGTTTATGARAYSGVVGLFAVCRPASTDFTVYAKEIGSAMETITPTWVAPPNAATDVYICSGWDFDSDATVMRVEYWIGANAASIDSTSASAFFSARGMT